MTNSLLKLSLFLFLLNLTYLAHGQSIALNVTNPKTGTTKTIQQNKRVKLRTLDGKRYTGKLQILENGSISVKGYAVALDNIYKLKKSPLIVSAITSGGLIYSGAVFVGIGGIVAIFGGPQPLLWMGIGGSLLYLGIKKPTFSKVTQDTAPLEVRIVKQ